MIENTVSSLTYYIRGLVEDLQKNDGRDPFTYEGDNAFTISESFVDSTSIIVYVNQVVISEDDWSFDSETNQVIIDFTDSSEELTTNDTIIITYGYYKKWSDLEIRRYLESSLSYFSVYRYKKIFIIDDDDNIVAVNSSAPEVNELYFIGVIASYIIDPQNIKISIPEFNLGKKREKSDLEQIKDAFRCFQKFAGNISFNKLDIYNYKD